MGLQGWQHTAASRTAAQPSNADNWAAWAPRASLGDGAGTTASGVKPKDPKMNGRKQEDYGIFPIWPFRFAVLGLGLTLLAVAIIVRFTAYKQPIQADLKCYNTTDDLSQNTVPIDFCAFRTAATGPTQCGQPAADLFCQSKDSLYSYSFERSNVTVNNTIALGNNAFGGQQTFSSICCDKQAYWPSPPRWLLWVSGLLLLYLVCLAVTKLVLLGVEVILVGLVATEALYFFAGFEPILKHVSYSIGLVIWTGQVFWVIWCGNSKECEDRWLAQPRVLLNVSECLMAFQLGRLAALTLGKTFGWAYFFRNQLPQVRRVLNQERYLSAMSTPHWANALIKAQEAAAAEAEAARERGDHSLVVGGRPPLEGPVQPKFHGGSVLNYLKQDKQLLDALPTPMARLLTTLCAPGGWLSCCKGPGKCCSSSCVRCCSPCCWACHEDEETDADGLTTLAQSRRPTCTDFCTVGPSAPSLQVAMNPVYGGVEAPPIATTAALVSGAIPIRSGRMAVPTTIPETWEGPAQGPAQMDALRRATMPRKDLHLPPRSLSRNMTITASAVQGETTGAGVAVAGGGALTNSATLARMLSRRPTLHHSPMAGVLEIGNIRRSSEAGFKEHSRSASDLSTLSRQRLKDVTGEEAHVGSPLKHELARRSLPVYSAAEDTQAVADLLHAQALERQAERERIQAQQDRMKQMAAQLNRELVAVDVGGVGALRKFTAFLHKYQSMSDDQLEKETRSLSARLFANLKAYLEPQPMYEQWMGVSHNVLMPRKAPSQASLAAGVTDSKAGAANEEERGSVVVDGSEFGLPHTNSSPALVVQGDGGSEGLSQEPEAINFTDFVAALRRARRGLHRSSTGSLAHTAKEAWQMFDKSHAQRLTEEDVRLTLQEVYKSRRNLALSIKANQAVCKSLEAAAAFVIQTALVFVYMAIFGLAVAFSSGLDFFKTYVLAFSFIFGDSVKALFQSAIYLFAEHPFDVGDTLKMGENTWVVEQFDLMFTVLVSGNGEWATMSNTSLINSQLINLTRSKARVETIKIKVPSNMPLEVLPAVKAAMKKVYEDAQGEYVESSIGCSIAEMETSQSLVLAAKWSYTFPPSEAGRMGKAKTAMQDTVIRTLLAEGVSAVPLQMDFNILSIKTKKD